MSAELATLPLVGRTLGEFVVRELLAEGGFGAVYRAEQPLLAREAVVKVLHARHRSDAAIIQRFLREAKLASKLDHPFAAHIYAFGAEPDGLLWIAMELVRGTTLDELLARKGPIPIDQLVPLVDHICEVLHSAHEQNIVHRDIKPANVMVLSRAGRLLPKLLDFGIAKVIDDEPTQAESPVALDALDDEVSVADTLGAGAITQAGVVIGSPQYMAPEQWVNGEVGQRTDLYALGAVVYEALTGRHLFTGKTMLALARAHALGTTVPLGEGFPPELDAVFRKAVAKQPSDRYQTALELAEAFRSASGVARDRVALPTIDETLREHLFVDAPQPIAEATARLHAARNAHQAYDAVWQTLEVVVRYLGLVALACRTKTGPSAGPDAQSVDESLRILHKRTLADEEWLDLVRALVAPFRLRRELYPMPELVELFDRSSSPFETLLSLRGESTTRGTELEVRDQLRRVLPELETLLRATSFLWEYPLVVPRGGVADRWMGVRTTKRACMVLTRAVPDGEPLLVTHDGTPVLQLAPLFQIAPPTMGTPEELFFFLGQGRRGARFAALPTGFERLDDDLWKWFRGTLLEVGVDDDATSAPTQATPYRGLAAFGPDNADTFFGRDREIDDALNRLRVNPLLAVVGPSGAGKSSFVQAGIVPSLPPAWRTLTMRPGAAPLATLRQRLARELDAPVESFADAFVALAKDGVLCLVVDQFEELFTLCQDADERRAFCDVIANAGRSIEGPTRVILTLRDDFLIRAEQEPALLLSHALLLVTTPAQHDLIRILVEPARRAGFEFEDAQLPEEMAREVEGQPGALPLLSFTASKLWEQRDRHFKQLTRRAYVALGGVGGALALHAEQTLAGMSPDEQRLVREAFRHLVTSEGTRAVLTRTELLEILRERQAALAVTEKLISSRLLAAREGDDGNDRVEVAHEALLSAWPRLVEWQRQDSEGARLRDQLRAAARQWDERGRPIGLVWRGDALAEYQLWRSRHKLALTSVEEAFGTASVDEAARGRRTRRLLLGAAFAALAIGLGAMYTLNQRSLRNARESVAHLAAFNAEQGRQLFLAGDPMRALVYFGEALRLGHDTVGLRFMLARAKDAMDRQRLVIDTKMQSVSDIAVSPDGRLIAAIGDGKRTIVWDTATGHERAALDDPDAFFVAWSGDSDKLVTTGRSETRVFSVGTSRKLFAVPRPTPINPDDHGARSLFSPDGATILATGGDDRLKRWSTVDGTPARPPFDASVQARSFAISRDGRRVVTASAGGDAQVVDLATGHVVRALHPKIGPLHFVATNADATRLVVCAEQSTAALLDSEHAVTLHTFRFSTSATNAEFSPDGTSFVIRGEVEPSMTIWSTDLSGSATITTRGRLTNMAFNQDGTLLATAGRDGVTHVWRVSDGQLVSSQVGHTDDPQRVRWSPDGSALYTQAFDRTIRAWDPRPSSLVLSLQDRAPGVTGQLDRSGKRLLTSTSDQALRTWDAQTGQLLSTLTPAPRGDGYFDTSAWDDTGAHILTTRGSSAQVWRSDGVTAASPPIALPTPITWASLAPDGTVIAAGDGAGVIRVVDVASARVTRTLTGHTGGIVMLAFSHDGRMIASASEDRSARLWDVGTGAARGVLLGHGRGRVEAVAFSADDRELVTAGLDQTLRTWSVARAELTRVLQGHTSQILDARYSEDGALIVSAGIDGERVWSTDNGQLLWHLPGVGLTVRTSHDGATLVVGGLERNVEVWDLRRDTRAPDAIARWLTERVPFLIAGDTVLPRPTQ